MTFNNKTVKALEAKEGEIPPLTLIPDEDEFDVKDSTKTGSFKLYSDPVAAGAAAGGVVAGIHHAKYSFCMPYADGSQSIRFHIKWVENVQKVTQGMGITEQSAKVAMIQQLCSGTIRTAFRESVENARADARMQRALTAGSVASNAAQGTTESNAAYEARLQAAYNASAAAPLDPATDRMIEFALTNVLSLVCPYKVLEKQKRYMRRKMRKPSDMKIRQYVNHLHRINYDELPWLPPAVTGQQLSDDELIDIVTFGIPKSWTKEMDRQDFNPYQSNVNLLDLVNFCERLESAEDFNPSQTKKKD